jgi:hypothetical protein
MDLGERVTRTLSADSPGRGDRPDTHRRARHLRAVLDEYAAHYNQHCSHRARDLRRRALPRTLRPIRRRMILGGLISEYERAA